MDAPAARPSNALPQWRSQSLSRGGARTASSSPRSAQAFSVHPLQSPVESPAPDPTAVLFGGARLRHAGTSRPVAVSRVAVVGFIVSVCVRAWHISHPAEVVFDEVHFGTFVGHYAEGAHFFDLHPPLGKLALYAVARASGYDGRFSFDKIGTKYNDTVPYVAMRAVPAVLGALLPPTAFLTLSAGGVSVPFALLGAALVLCDTALHAHSRLILLDNFLLAGVALALWLLVLVRIARGRPRSLSRGWWLLASATGLAIALAVCSKLNGAFVAMVVAYYAARDVLAVVGAHALDIERADWSPVLRHAGARALCFAAIPVVVYVALFAVHFRMIERPGPGDPFMGLAYREHLHLRSVTWGPPHVAFGSKVRLRLVGDRPLFLSHGDARAADGTSRVVGLAEPPAAVEWTVSRPPQAKGGTTGAVVESAAGTRLVRYGDFVSLRSADGGWLSCEHSGAARGVGAEAVERDLTLSSLIDEAKAASCATWRVTQSGASGAGEGGAGEEDALRSYFGHVTLRCGCDECAAGATGHSAAEGMVEAKCAGGGAWRVEGHANPELMDEEIPKGDPRSSSGGPSFARLFFEVNYAMVVANANLRGTHDYASYPWSWPFLWGGVSYWMGPDNSQIYLIGNPLVWWLTATCAIAALVIQAVECVHWLAEFDEPRGGRRPLPSRTGDALGVFVCAYLFSYLPFFLMDRLLFLHHYLPALYCACLVAPLVLERITHATLAAVAPHCADAVSTVSWLVCATAGFCVCRAFLAFRPLAEGTPMALEDLRALQWLPAWNFQYV